MGGKGYCVVSGLIFTLVALVHLLRLLYGLSIQVDDAVIPMTVSLVGLIVSSGLAIWAFRIIRGSSVT